MFERTEQEIAQESPRLHEFRETMRRLRRAEEEKRNRGEHYRMHFMFFDGRPWDENELTEEDANIYQKYTEGALTVDEFKKYRQQFQGSKENSRELFSEYLANLLQILQIENAKNFIKKRKNEP